MVRHLLIAATLALTGPAFAGGWSIATDDSKIVFGSIKLDSIGESHQFTGISGGVDARGQAEILIDVTTVDTGIDIRDERMQEYVLRPEIFPKAKLTAKIDLDRLADMVPGETALIPTEATLAFLDREIPMTPTLFVAPLTGDRVLVTTDALIMLSTEDLGIEKGVGALMEIAGLPSITRASPIMARLVFQRD